jgi:DNA-directed RNA polymerase subunit beta'
MGLLLDLSIGALRSILYYEKYVVIDAGDTDLKKMQLLSEEEYMEAREGFGLGVEAAEGLNDDGESNECAVSAKGALNE